MATSVAQIITDAYRQSNLVAVGTTPNTNQVTEALHYLNRIVRSVFGNEVGEHLQDVPVGKTNYNRPSGYPYDDYQSDTTWYVPENSRIILNLSSAASLYLHPNPDAGTRFAVIDANNNVGTYNVTINGNGRMIEGGLTVTLSTSGVANEWMYRDDLANWVKYSTLLSTDTFPFPERFDDFFITELAIRLNPSYGVAMNDQVATAYKKARKQLQSRYRQHRPVGVEKGLVRLPSNPYRNALSDNTTAFNKGRTS
jgi:hypothetical protein